MEPGVFHDRTVAGDHVLSRAVAAAYADARGRAMSSSTLRLRWQLRRLPQHSLDETVMAKVKALRDELRWRGQETE